MNAIDSPTLTQSFEVIRSKLRDPEFLACHGLGNEVPFHVFPYDAGSELEVRALLRDLLSEDPAGLAPARITHIDLWELICDLCEQRGLMKSSPPSSASADCMLLARDACKPSPRRQSS